MCGSVRHEKRSIRMGQPVVVLNAAKETVEAPWAGFLRRESLNFWKSKTDLIPVHILADSFEEQGHIIKVPQGYINGMGIISDVHLYDKRIGRSGSVKILTRGAKTEWERKIHARWPITYDKSGLVHIYSSRDLISRQMELK